MATGDRVRTTWQYQHEILDAAAEQGWRVTRLDERGGITLEESFAGGAVLVVTPGHYTDLPMFIRTLPEARQPYSPAPDAVEGIDYRLTKGGPEPLERRFSRSDPNREPIHRGGERS